MTNYWRWTALIVYVVICLFDFVIVPSYIGLTRPNPAEHVATLLEIEDTMVRVEYLKVASQGVNRHEPFTLTNGGIFHISFGALLTGSVFGMRGDNNGNKN
mgnify:FL=1